KAIAMTGPGTWLPDYHAERILLDTVAGGKFGGTGVPFPWRWARALIMANPTLELILAGGLTPENVGRAITESRPFGVDVASGVEGRSGRKDIYRVRDFIAAAAAESVTASGGVGVREFQGDDVGQVLRLLARQAKVNMVVSDQVTGTVTMRLEDVTALQAIAIIVKAKGLSLDQIDHVYYIK